MTATGIQPRLRAGLAMALDAASIVTWSPLDALPASPAHPPIFDTSYPESPDVAVALSTYYLGGDGKVADTRSAIQLQVRTRGQRDGPSTDADDLDDAIAQYLLAHWPTTLPNGVRISSLERVSGTPLGRDVAGRFERVTNWRLMVADPAPYRV